MPRIDITYVKIIQFCSFADFFIFDQGLNISHFRRYGVVWWNIDGNIPSRSTWLQSSALLP